MFETLLAVRHLSCHYKTLQGAVKAVDGVSFDLHRGEVLGIVGSSGSGKSTLALSILGLLDHSAIVSKGNIEFKGQYLGSLNEKDWQQLRGSQIGMIFQSAQNTFNPVMTIGQHIIEALSTHRTESYEEAKTKAIDALKMVGMLHPEKIMQCYSFELSGGMCQRAALALAISLQPDVLIADEPTASLDVLSQSEIIDLLITISKQLNLAMIIITHDLSLAAKISDCIAVMAAGKFVETGSSAQIFRNPANPYTKDLLASALSLSGHSLHY